MARAIDQSAKQTYHLVQFTVDGVPYRFTNWGTTIDPSGDNWLSIPAMEIKWPNNVGSLNDGNASIKCLENASVTMLALVELLLSSGAPAPEVEVLIREVISSPVAGVEATELVPYKGYVHRALRNAGGRSKTVQFELVTQKSRLEVKMGLPCNHHCVWSLFGKGCSVQGGPNERGPQLADHQVTDLGVVAISGKTIQLHTSPGLTGTRSLVYGYITRGSVSIGVQNWDASEPTIVLLRQEPPSSWLNEFVTAVPGCVKTADRCLSDWDNLPNFGGIGYAIPAYNPSFEDSP